MTNTSYTSQRMMRNVLIVVLILAALGIAYALFTRNENRGDLGDRAHNAVNAISDGIDNAAEELKVPPKD